MLPFIALLALVTANPSAPSVQLNDNTSPAGRVESGRLTVSLVVSMGAWKPEGPDGALLSLTRAFQQSSSAAHRAN